MPFDAWLTYVATVLVLMSTPGPSHLLILLTSLANGFARSMATAAGDLSVNVMQMLAAGLGLAAIIVASETAFRVVKWLGVAYLLWLGVRLLIRSARPAAGLRPASRAALGVLWLRGFATSAANPKAVVFFAALFPQFIAAEGDFWLQMLILAATYLALDATFLSAYAGSAAWVARRLKGSAGTWLDRASGTTLIGAAILLASRAVHRS